MPQATNYNIPVFWDYEYRDLHYVTEAFNDVDQVAEWQALGYHNNFVGEMCDMRRPQPSWNQRFIDIFGAMGWQNIGTSYYRMNTGTVLPTHVDLYTRYCDLHGLHDQKHRICRAIVFLEPWSSGHYFEVMNRPVTNWTAGTVIQWSHDAPHMAANLGREPRYTLQITGHL